MSNVFDELNNINLPLVEEAGKVQFLNYQPFLDDLAKNPNQLIPTAGLIDFVNTLGKNKSGSKNAIGRLQYFLNAYIQEMALISRNQNLEFVKNDHTYLSRDNVGDPAPDFNFYPSNGQTYTIDAKMYGTIKSYFINLDTTNFHDADYALIFIVKEAPHWLVSKKSEGYQTLYTFDELVSTDPWLLEIALPTYLKLIRFDVDGSATDAELPEDVGYFFYTK